MISRFPSTIDYEMLDSIVNACKKDKECWEKAQKTGEIYKGDYTTILRDSSGLRSLFLSLVPGSVRVPRVARCSSWVMSEA